MTRRKLGRQLGIPEHRLRYWTEIGLLPLWDSVPETIYAERLRLILHARACGMTVQQIRRALVETRQSPLPTLREFLAVEATA